jgi:hypothetical protein
MILDLPLSCKYLLFSIDISTIKEKHRRDIFVIGGDFNLPDINWEEQTIINRQYPIKTNQSTLLSMVFCIASFKACQSDSISLFPMFRNVFPNDPKSSFILYNMK